MIDPSAQPNPRPPVRRLTFQQAHKWAATFISRNVNPAEPITVDQVHQWMMGALMAGFVRGCESLEGRIAELEAAAAAEKERGKN